MVETGEALKDYETAGEALNDVKTDGGLSKADRLLVKLKDEDTPWEFLEGLLAKLLKITRQLMSPSSPS